MCEIFGVSYDKEASINELLKAFYSHSVNQPHGWGLALADENSINIEKSRFRQQKAVI